MLSSTVPPVLGACGAALPLSGRGEELEKGPVGGRPEASLVGLHVPGAPQTEPLQVLSGAEQQRAARGRSRRPGVPGAAGAQDLKTTLGSGGLMGAPLPRGGSQVRSWEE
ncbi:hypothetical protein NDU88_001204 [Pleurodeles waltl]|uniref:Uncharacterized protein n=1 Tax=Pleurodeles waltl TaxID=8319 RepID=A0AAV7THX9_PLEWA|nr:hypothetical protein NDU88_001204 [Pleurodeles waltl]